VPTSPLKADITYGFKAIGKIKELEEKLNNGGGSSYDDSEIREELSKKLEGEVVGTTTPTEGSIGGSYDDTEIRQEIAELSAEVGKKVDADFVNNAIAEAIGEAIDGGY
jgi:hypothetical protein